MPAFPAAVTVNVDHVSFSYRSLHAPAVSVFSDLSLSVDNAECVGLMGRERSGKSTALQLIDGLLRAESGTVRVAGINVGEKRTSLADLRRKIGYMFQFPEQQFFSETVAEELRWSLRLQGASGDEMEMISVRALEMVGLAPGAYLDRSPFTLSFGESKRLALALVMVIHPRLVLADEPTAGLDGAGVSIALNAFRDLHAGGSTLILATHDVDFLAELATRIVIVSDGAIAADGPAGELLTNKALLARFGYDPPQIVTLLDEWRQQGVLLPRGILRAADLSRQGRTGGQTE